MSRYSLPAMLTWARPHLSKTEDEFIATYLEPLPGYFEDEIGNGFVYIGDSSPIMWSCHTDTVHVVGGRQKIYVDENKWVSLAKSSKSNCLGADNTVGVWLLREMILEGVPGLYVFHRGEEKGRIGSSWIEKNSKNLLKDIDFAIAFDRRNVKSVITYQCGQRTCSDNFGNQMIKLLGMGHELDEGGLYTDTYSYSGLVSECTNISAGFFNEHSSSETVNLKYVQELRNKLVSTDWSQLKAYRDPAEVDYHSNNYFGNWKSYSSSDTSIYDDIEFDTMVNLVFKYPDEIAEYLINSGITIDDLYDHIGRG